MERYKERPDGVERWLTPGELKAICFSICNLTDETCKGKKGEIIYGKQFTVYALKSFFPKLSLQTLAGAVHLTSHATALHNSKVIANQLELEKDRRMQRYTVTWHKIYEMAENLIKAKERAQVDIINRLSEALSVKEMENYYLNPAISNSSLSLIDPESGGAPAKFKDYIDGKFDDEKTPSLEKGDYIHKFILTPAEFSVLTCEMPSETIQFLVKSIFTAAAHKKTAEEQKALELTNYKTELLTAANAMGYQKNWKDDTRVNKLVEMGTPYFNALKQAGDRTILDGDLYENVKKCAESVKRNAAANLLLINSPGQEVFNEIEIFWTEEWNGLNLSFKAKLDRLVIDHTAKTFSIVDFKTTSKFIVNFPDAVEYYHYYRQIAFYEHAVRQWLEGKGLTGYQADDHYIVAVETTRGNLCRTYVIGEPYLRKGRKETAELLNRIVYHFSTGDWINPKEEQETVNKTYMLMPKEHE